MTQEQKDLLLKDLCGRLTHGVKCKILETNEVKILGSIQYDGENTLFDFWEDDQKIKYGYQLYLSEFRPYLFHMSSMTVEQQKEYRKICDLDMTILENRPMKGEPFPAMFNSQDWLDAHHFDYRGLIPMGLAIDATNKDIY